MTSVEENSSLKKDGSQARGLIRQLREVFRAERKQANAALRVERSEAAAAQEHLRAETENLRPSMEKLQRRVEGKSGFARGECFAGFGPVGGLEGPLPARRAAGSGFSPAGFQAPRSSVNGDSGTASAPRIFKNMAPSSFTKKIKAAFPKFKRDLITLAKQHDPFRVFTEEVEMSVAGEEKSVEEIQAMGFTEEETHKHFLAWNILYRAIKGKTGNEILRRVTSPTAAWRAFPKFKRDLITLAKQHGPFRVFTKEVEMSVADEEKSVEEIQAMGFTEEEIHKHFLAWNILYRAIKGKTGNDILRQVTSPIAAWRVLVGSHSSTTQGAKLQRMKALTNRRGKPGSNVIHTLSDWPMMP